ncbi:MAG TPA: T9SS type A sorting domain-containing protein, partial [Candidatus Eisenbacteria bacterium]|nr:T9SS type A sorting domain-containing protein [Candidatus Eisenbacteria bacterium]
PTNLVAAPPDTGYVDGGPAGSYYKLSAVDMHGNESGFALLAPAGTLATGPEPGLTLSLAGALPNPATSRRLSVAFVLPAAGPAELELLDVGGRCVARRDVSALGAGRHAVDLAAGRAVAPGLYLVRLRFGGEVRSVRVAVLG